MMTDGTLTLKIAERFDDRGNIMRLTLISPHHKPLPVFEAGAHLDILIKDNLWRQYSLCGDPSEQGCYRLGILKDPHSRGGSVALHGRAVTGAQLTVSEPRNHFPLNEDAHYSLLLAGGIGVTPLLAMAYRLCALGRRFDLHYCTRSQSVTAFMDTIDQLPFKDAITVHHDDQNTPYHLNMLPKANLGTHLYVCGPSGFMDWIINAARHRGHQDDHIHREYFSADVDHSGQSFEVEARASGLTVSVGAQETIIAALARAGISVEVKCEEGVCGTCILDVLEGEPDHRDHFLTDEEKASNTEMTPCCSRAKSARLVLDI